MLKPLSFYLGPYCFQIMKNISAQFASFDEKPHRLAFPFHIDIDPMERLLLVNFEKDPDAVYLGFEPQFFNDSVIGTGHLIIGWRTDRKTDLYHEPSLKLDPTKYSITGAGLNQMIEVKMDVASFEINHFGAQVNYAFKDILGRAIKIKISERNNSKRKPFGILAPMGDAALNPFSMPLVFLHDFYFVRQKDSEINVSIDSRTHKIDELPMRLDFQKMTFIRYSPKPLIATFNPAFDGLLQELEIDKGQKIAENKNSTFELEWSNEQPFVKSMEVKNQIHPLKISLNPSLPCLNSIGENQKHFGEFHISGHPSVGSVSGSFIVKSGINSVSIKLNPHKGWKPTYTKFSTWFLFNVSKIFKKWPTTYQWKADLAKNDDGKWYMRSNWKRTGRISHDS